MKKHLFVIVALLFSCFFAKAQDTHKSQPDSLIKIIPVSEGRHDGFLYTVNGKLQSQEDIKLKLLSYEPSSIEYRAAKNNFKWALISLGGFTASGLTAFIEFKNNSQYNGATTAIINGQPEFVYQHHDKTAAYVFTGVATSFLVAEIITFVKAAKHGRKAIKLYNQRFE